MQLRGQQWLWGNSPLRTDHQQIFRHRQFPNGHNQAGSLIWPCLFFARICGVEDRRGRPRNGELPGHLYPIFLSECEKNPSLASRGQNPSFCSLCLLGSPILEGVQKFKIWNQTQIRHGSKHPSDGALRCKSRVASTLCAT